jgi:hypothetical protein
MKNATTKGEEGVKHRNYFIYAYIGPSCPRRDIIYKNLSPNVYFHYNGCPMCT